MRARSVPELAMFGFTWLAVRQVQAAIEDGRLEEAQRLLDQPSLHGHRRHGELLRELAQRFVDRGERHLRGDDVEAAWRDLLHGEQLGTSERGTERLRQALTRLGMAQARAALEAGDPKRAGQLLGQLRNHFVRGAEMQLLEETTRSWLTAQELAEQGDFGDALQTVERMQRLLLGPAAPLDQFRQVLQSRQADFGDRLTRLHEAIDDARWRDVLELAESILALAPQHAEAKRARSRAWRAIEPATVIDRPRNEPSPSVPGKEEDSAQRFFLWVDGVGGYLVCLTPTITLGQASPDTPVDVPLMADVSRLHATVTRDGEGGYLLESSRPVQVNGTRATRSALRPGDRLTLGKSCQVQFHKPAPLSTSARLDLVSGHRSLPGIDAVLLMSDTLILGAGEQSHVRIPGMKQSLVLFRTRDGLGIRYPGRMTVNGETVEDRVSLSPTAHVSGDEFSLAIEPARGQP